MPDFPLTGSGSWGEAVCCPGGSISSLLPQDRCEDYVESHMCCTCPVPGTWLTAHKCQLLSVGECKMWPQILSTVVSMPFGNDLPASPVESDKSVSLIP